MTSPSTSFDLLAKPIQRWIWDQKWNALRDIQEYSIPLLLQQADDVVISASTASGKTEAAFLPLISRVLKDAATRRGFRLMYISPLKALINDQFRRLEMLCETVEIPVHPWHGDVAASKKAAARKNPSGIILITPESLEAQFVLRGHEITNLFGALDCVVIDELHALLNNERGIHLRSLLNRIEIAAKRPIRRVGLSATLGDMDQVKIYLRPDTPERVKLIQSKVTGQELKLQVRGHLTGLLQKAKSMAYELREQLEAGNVEENIDQSVTSIAADIFHTLRGSHNLVFCGSRQKVELLADQLWRRSKKEKVQCEFYPHHANLAREHREFVERRLKEEAMPTTVICTSTLELGIDIGEVESVAQIEAPFSVASLRQRLGRSGRRTGESVLRMYVSQRELQPNSHPVEALRLNLIRAISMIDLILQDRWCEPPEQGALHLSTLVQQILSMIAERNGVNAKELFITLCERGPFGHISAELFKLVLRQIGNAKVDLISQSPDGDLLLGDQGDRIVNDYRFYAVFATPDEYRVISRGKTLGTMPLMVPLAPNMTIIFSGRRWRVLKVDDRAKVILVAKDAAGRPPMFGGDIGPIHDKVVSRMYEVLAREDIPRYLDPQAIRMLIEGRKMFHIWGLAQRAVFSDGSGATFIVTRSGTVKTFSLLLALRQQGIKSSMYDGLLEVEGPEDELQTRLKKLATSPPPTASSLASNIVTPRTEKYHSYLSNELLLRDVAAHRIDPEAVPALARQILEAW